MSDNQKPVELTPDERTLALEVYKATFETWRFQVDSYWQRSSYFAAFETATIAGCWFLIDSNKLFPGLAFSILGLVLTGVWLLSNSATHTYVLHWWNGLKAIEGKLGLEKHEVAFVTEHRGSGNMVPYRYLVQSVPVIFAFAWSTLVVLGLWKLCVRLHP